MFSFKFGLLQLNTATPCDVEGSPAVLHGSVEWMDAIAIELQKPAFFKDRSWSAQRWCSTELTVDWAVELSDLSPMERESQDEKVKRVCSMLEDSDSLRLVPGGTRWVLQVTRWDRSGAAPSASMGPAAGSLLSAVEWILAQQRSTSGCTLCISIAQKKNLVNS